jgi:hypothetical protein
VHFRSLRNFTSLAFATVLLGAASTAYAGPKDKEAQKLYDGAINEDYLNADFPKAEKKLKDAIGKCGSDGCSKELLGKLHIALGTVHGVGLSKLDDAKADFVNALKADPKAILDPSLTTPELTKAFDEAKKSAGSGSSGSKPEPKPAPAGDASFTPPAESPVNVPLPLYIEPSEEVPLSKVIVRYKPFGATQYQSVELKKLGKGYGGEIPCADVTTTGDMKYFFAFTGTDGEPAGGMGSNKEPFRTTLKNDIEGDAPHLPGKKAPNKCSKKDCPPGFTGADCQEMVDGSKPKDSDNACSKRADKGWGSSCETACDCKEGLTCLNGTCEEDKGGGGGGKGDDGKKKRMNLVSVGVQFDLLLIKGANDVCSISNPDAASFACFRSGTNEQYFGNPVAVGSTNGVQGGFGFGDVRILAGYDRQLVKSLGLSIGLRAGFAIGGSPSPDITKIPNGVNPAKSFLPVHAELRLAYHLLGSMMEDKKFRPYVFINPIGFAQVNASVPVTVCDPSTTAGDPAPQCDKNDKTKGYQRQLSAYQITGLTFSGLGVGTTFGITPLFGIAAEVKVMFMWPTFGVVFAPNIGPVFSF